MFSIYISFVIGLKSGLMFGVRFSFGNLDHHVEFRKLEMRNQEADECHAKTWLKIYTNKWLEPYTNEMTKTYTNIWLTAHLNISDG